VIWRRTGRPEEPSPPDLLQHLPVGVVLVDREDVVRTANATAERLRLVRDRQLAPIELRRLVRAVRRVGDLQVVEVELPNADESLPVRATGRPLPDRDVLLVVEDLTELRRVEQVRRDFVANVSHELKTPVGALILLAEAVREAAGDPKAVDHFVERMQAETRRLTKLVDDVISLSRLQTGVPPGVARLPVYALIDAAGQQVALAAEARDVRIDTNVPDSLAVTGREAELVVAVKNLLDNAVHYSPPGSTVRVTAERDGDNVRVTVADTGPGIAPIDQQRVFERFYRADPARARTSGGSGLGLAIVKHVVTNHGGSVSVDSALGEGSTFTIRLPAAEAPARVDA
jgi:two-component system sensor histidine kinase SenX3